MAFHADCVAQHLKTEGLTLEVYPCVDSTNTMLKKRGHEGAPHGLVIAAAQQTAGRGRMGRSFFSPNDTGVYFSILLRPQLSPADSLLITTAAAVAVARALEALSGRQAHIKWVNDIYMDGKKVCGVLTEAAFRPDGAALDFAVLGIGINLHVPAEGFPKDIENKAGSVLPESHGDVRGMLVAMVLDEFFTLYPTLKEKSFVDDYRARSLLDGMSVDVIKPDGVTPAKALYVTEDLSLMVAYECGKTEALYSGDVSIRTT